MPEWFPDCRTRRACATRYAALLCTLPSAYLGWPEINAEILSRYTVSGLEWIKRRAWEIARGGHRYAVPRRSEGPPMPDARLEEIRALRRSPAPKDIDQALKRLAEHAVALDELLALLDEARGVLDRCATHLEAACHDGCPDIRAARALLARIKEDPAGRAALEDGR